MRDQQDVDTMNIMQEGVIKGAGEEDEGGEGWRERGKEGGREGRKEGGGRKERRIMKREGDERRARGTKSLEYLSMKIRKKDAQSGKEKRQIKTRKKIINGYNIFV